AGPRRVPSGRGAPRCRPGVLGGDRRLEQRATFGFGGGLPGCRHPAARIPAGPRGPGPRLGAPGEPGCPDPRGDGEPGPKSPCLDTEIGIEMSVPVRLLVVCGKRACGWPCGRTA